MLKRIDSILKTLTIGPTVIQRDIKIKSSLLLYGGESEINFNYIFSSN
jgi:hypothetical protein